VGYWSWSLVSFRKRTVGAKVCCKSVGLGLASSLRMSCTVVDNHPQSIGQRLASRR
jgi:hypothetical protein